MNYGLCVSIKTTLDKETLKTRMFGDKNRLQHMKIFVHVLGAQESLHTFAKMEKEGGTISKGKHQEDGDV